MQWTISGNEQDTIENMNHFCEILLQVWSKGGRKHRFRYEFNATTLGEYQIGDDTASTGNLGLDTVTVADMSKDLFL